MTGSIGSLLFSNVSVLESSTSRFKSIKLLLCGSSKNHNKVAKNKNKIKKQNHKKTEKTS